MTVRENELRQRWILYEISSPKKIPNGNLYENSIQTAIHSGFHFLHRNSCGDERK